MRETVMTFKTLHDSPRILPTCTVTLGWPGLEISLRWISPFLLLQSVLNAYSIRDSA